MFSFELTRVALAAVGALVLSTLSVTAAVGPGTSALAAPTAYASVQAPGSSPGAGATANA